MSNNRALRAVACKLRVYTDLGSIDLDILHDACIQHA